MFRRKYLDYAELSQQLAAWSKQYPDDGVEVFTFSPGKLDKPPYRH